MPAFIISQVVVRDPEAFEAYRQMAARSIQHFGGQYVVRGGAQTVLEGDWTESTVIVKFESADVARAWYASAEYAPARSLAASALSRNLVLVEGTNADAFSHDGPPGDPA